MYTFTIMSLENTDVHRKCVKYYKMGKHVSNLWNLRSKLILQRIRLAGTTHAEESFFEGDIAKRLFKVEYDIREKADLEDCGEEIKDVYSELLEKSLQTTAALLKTL
jgi:hypothetical protein